MTPVQLRHLLAIVEHGSLGRAAEQLRISEPALSKSLKGLEDELGVRLMDRGPKGMTATVYGESLANHARIIRTEFSRALTEIEELKGAGRGQVAVGATHAFGASLLPEAVSRLLARKPGIRVEVSLGLFQDLVPRLLRAELDLVVISLRDQPPSPELGQITLRTERAAALARSGHPLAGRAKLALSEVAAFPLVLPMRGDRSRLYAEERFAEAGLSCNPCVEFDSVTFAREMLLRTEMVTFLPVEALRPDIDAGRIAVLDVASLEWTRPVGILYGRRNSLSPAASALIAEMQAVAEHPSKRRCRGSSG